MSLTFLDFGRLVPVINWVSLVAERKTAKPGESAPDGSAGRRLGGTPRGERVSGHRLCVFARWGETEQDCPVVLPYKTEAFGGR